MGGRAKERVNGSSGMTFTVDLWLGHKHYTQRIKRLVRHEQERMNLGSKGREARERGLGWCDEEWRR